MLQFYGPVSKSPIEPLNHLGFLVYKQLHDKKLQGLCCYLWHSKNLGDDVQINMNRHFVDGGGERFGGVVLNEDICVEHVHNIFLNGPF